MLAMSVTHGPLKQRGGKRRKVRERAARLGGCCEINLGESKRGKYVENVPGKTVACGVVQRPGIFMILPFDYTTP